MVILPDGSSVIIAFWSRLDNVRLPSTVRLNIILPQWSIERILWLMVESLSWPVCPISLLRQKLKECPLVSLLLSFLGLTIIPDFDSWLPDSFGFGIPNSNLQSLPILDLKSNVWVLELSIVLILIVLVLIFIEDASFKKDISKSLPDGVIELAIIPDVSRTV